MCNRQVQQNHGKHIYVYSIYLIGPIVFLMIIQHPFKISIIMLNNHVLMISIQNRIVMLNYQKFVKGTKSLFNTAWPKWFNVSPCKHFKLIFTSISIPRGIFTSVLNKQLTMYLWPPAKGVTVKVI